jgi:hypothetical protein
MKKEKKMVYFYSVPCSDCNQIKYIYYTVADFGDAPYIRHCKYCGELYWYTPDDEAYVKSIDAQLNGKKCEKCKADLKNALVPTHRNIQCCGKEFSLDDDFISPNIPPNTAMIPIEVYLIYS